MRFMGRTFHDPNLKQSTVQEKVWRLNQLGTRVSRITPS